MLGYLPNFYPDELVYSWASRYYCHNGYPGYRQALEDLLIGKNDKIQFEFSGRFNSETLAAITSMISYRDFILEHTMFPYYARFERINRRYTALNELCKGNTNINSLLTIPYNSKERHLSYCPLCVQEDRNQFGETYFHRIHQIRGIRICHKHCCKLIDTPIKIYSNASPRLHVPEEVIPQQATVTHSNEEEYKFANYIAELFLHPISFANDVPIGEFLKSKIEDSPYCPPSGLYIYTKALTESLNNFFPWQEPMKQHSIQKVLSGDTNDFMTISKIGYFLGISICELASPILPSKTKTEQFRESISDLRKQGLSFVKISRILEASQCAIYKVIKPLPPKPHFRGVRKGMQAQNWSKMDIDSLPAIKGAIEKIRNGNGRPGRVTIRAICKAMGWPSKRLDNLPLCKAEVQKNIAPIEEFWAKEVVWAYIKLRKEDSRDKIRWRDIRDLTNIRREQFLSTFPLLTNFTTPEIAEEIQGL